MNDVIRSPSVTTHGPSFRSVRLRESFLVSFVVQSFKEGLRKVALNPLSTLLNTTHSFGLAHLNTIERFDPALHYSELVSCLDLGQWRFCLGSNLDKTITGPGV